MRDQDVTKVEFLLMCNDNIVVQRFFNVKGFNKNAHKSEEFYDYIRRFTEKLKYNLKMRSVVYMLDNQYEIGENPDMLNTSAQELLRVTQDLQSQIDQILSKDNFTN